ncbi:MAG: DUF6502 family protein [Janthinobacterium lividum]
MFRPRTYATRSREASINVSSTRPSPPLVLRAAAHAARPLIRLLVRSGVTFPVFADVLRTIFVQVAGEVLDADGQERSDSRISLLTGIHRKELRRQRLEPTDDAEPAVVTLNSRLIARWLGEPAYLDAFGAPLPLPRSGLRPSFETLAAGVTKDVHPRSILDDLLAHAIVSIDSNDVVTLLARAFLPTKSEEAKLFYFARNLHDHAAAASANVLEAAPPFIDRAVHYDGLSRAAAATLEEAARMAAEQTVLTVNRQALAIADADVPDGLSRRVIMGVYVYVEDEVVDD